MPGVGVDVVDLARMESSRVGARICTDAESEWIAAGDDVVRLAACFALKEARIKAHGGRPPGFDWRAFAYDPAASTIAGLPAAWGVLGDAVVAVVGSAAVMVGARAVVTTSPHDAGRVAAVAAVRALIGPDPSVEIAAGEHPADDPAPCRGTHPPRVLVDNAPGPVQVTISHGPTLAVAVAWVT